MAYLSLWQKRLVYLTEMQQLATDLDAVPFDDYDLDHQKMANRWLELYRALEHDYTPMSES